MKKTLVIFKKEFLDTVRDRRTIMLMIVVPLLVFPLIMGIFTKLSVSQRQKAAEKELNVALITHGNAAGFKSILMERKDMKIDESVNEADIEQLIKDNKLDFAIVFESDFDIKTSQKESGSVKIHFRSSQENRIAKRRINDVLDKFEKELLGKRLAELNLEKSFIEPIKVENVDIATVKQKIGEAIGGFLPYIFIIFCFMGAMYPAIDLGAGEKEKSTIETLLTSPTSRMQIVTGKFLVITAAGLISALVSIGGLYIAVKTAVKIPDHILDALLKIVAPSSILLMLSLLIPLCVFFAALLLSLSIYAKSFKEAQSIMTPLNLVVILPAILGMLPGIKLTVGTAMIPILNVCLATKDIISGTIQPGLLVVVYLSLFVLAALSLLFCTRWFNREDVIFRGI